LNLPEYDARVLTESPDLAAYFEKAAEKIHDKKTASNWVMGPVMRALKEFSAAPAELKVMPAYLAEILALLENDTISSVSAKMLFDECLATGKEPNLIVREKGLLQMTDNNEIENAVASVIEGNAKDVQDFLSGNDKVLGFLMGQVMRATAGKANPKIINQMLRDKLALLRKNV